MTEGRPSLRETRAAALRKGEERRSKREARRDRDRQETARRKSGKEPVKKEAQEAHPRSVGTERILADDGSLPHVQITCFSLRGYQAHQKQAADAFGRDWEAAYGSLRCRGFEPAAGAARTHADHLRRVAAQERIKAVQKKIGDEKFPLLVVSVIAGFGPAKISETCGVEHGEISRDLREILNKLAEFYDPTKRYRARQDIAAEKILARFPWYEECIAAADRNAG